MEFSTRNHRLPCRTSSPLLLFLLHVRRSLRIAVSLDLVALDADIFGQRLPDRAAQLLFLFLGEFLDVHERLAGFLVLATRTVARFTTDVLKAIFLHRAVARFFAVTGGMALEALFVRLILLGQQTEGLGMRRSLPLGVFLKVARSAPLGSRVILIRGGSASAGDEGIHIAAIPKTMRPMNASEATPIQRNRPTICPYLQR